ncbi:hypothetical protein M885DRAFT_3312 [Pelagophyceae sp. CCMP2097]|nr:hypothetical protein M885DRAFT_3312 [Pelagophyceae sp. CCMP2097]
MLPRVARLSRASRRLHSTGAPIGKSYDSFGGREKFEETRFIREREAFQRESLKRHPGILHTDTEAAALDPTAAAADVSCVGVGQRRFAKPPDGGGRLDVVCEDSRDLDHRFRAHLHKDLDEMILDSKIKPLCEADLNTLVDWGFAVSHTLKAH